MKSLIVKLPQLPRKLRFHFYKNWNFLIFKINGVKFGRNLKVFNRLYLFKHPEAIITIGDNFFFTSGDSFNPLCRNIRGSIYLPENRSELIIGDNVGISSACIWAKESITIGNRVLIGGDSIILDTDAHNLDYHVRALRCERYDSKDNLNMADKLQIESHLLKERTLDSLTAKSAPIVIEDDVLIGTRCIILKGVTIGARSIIGSGSVVTKSIPSDCIAAGNPAKVIKYNKK